MLTALRCVSLITITVTITAIGLSGCGSGQSRNAATVKTSAAVPIDATTAKQELDHVLAALKGMRDASDTANLKALYGELKTHSSRLGGLLNDVQASSQSAVAAGKAQIAKWHEQANTFTDADLRNSSNRRESELRQSVDALSASSASLKTVSDSYSSRLTQTLTALDLDLSQPGVQSIKPIIAKLVDDEGNLRGALTDVAAKSRAVNALTNP